MANDFSGDANCKALWRFESGALTTDSKGTNTLTDVNTVTEDTVNYKEGACSADFELDNTEYFSITNANLNAGFPLKSDDVTKNISIAGWFRLESLPAASGTRTLYAKTVIATNKRSFLVGVYNDAGTYKFRLAIGLGSSWESKLHAPTNAITTAQWYHFGAIFENSTKAWKIRFWDATNSQVDESSGTTTNNISVSDAWVNVGSQDGTQSVCHDGLEDEVVVFDDVLTSGEIDQIRLGIYGTVKPWYAYAQM